MDLKLSFYGCLCSTCEFVINGIQAEYEDFGEKYDHEPEIAEPYCCGNMMFDRKDATESILSKYKITRSEYEEICDLLGEGLSFGGCRWCS